MVTNEYISKQQFYKLRSSDSILPKAYRLLKVHKNNIPFRIIVSSVINQTSIRLILFIFIILQL